MNTLIMIENSTTVDDLAKAVGKTLAGRSLTDNARLYVYFNERMDEAKFSFGFEPGNAYEPGLYGCIRKVRPLAKETRADVYDRLARQVHEFRKETLAWVADRDAEMAAEAADALAL